MPITEWITELTPTYIPLFQKPFCCNATCLSMILYRRGFGLFDQERLAQLLGAKVDEASKDLFYLPQSVGRVGEELGINTVTSSETVNELFKILNLPLQAESVKASSIRNLAEFIHTHLEQNHDLWTELKIHEMKGEESIHDNVIERIEHTGSGIFVTLVDPLPEYKTRITLPVQKLERAISNEFDRETGFLVISDLSYGQRRISTQRSEKTKKEEISMPRQNSPLLY